MMPENLKMNVERRAQLISLRMEDGLLEWVDSVAEHIGTSRSAAIRTILGYVRDLDLPDASSATEYSPY